MSHSARNRCALAVVTKTPRAGQVKTRLVPPLTHEEAATLARHFLEDTASNIESVAAAHCGRAFPVAVYTPSGSERDLQPIIGNHFALVAQRGIGFGDRLANAIDDLAGFDAVCLIDSDSPTLPSQYLDLALDALSRPGDRVVLGPCADGGYYLIGLKRAHRRLFEDIAWSTASVYEQTCWRARELGLDVLSLPPWYDVDDAATLQDLCAEVFDGGRPHGYAAWRTRRYLADLFAHKGRAYLDCADPMIGKAL